MSKMRQFAILLAAVAMPLASLAVSPTRQDFISATGATANRDRGAELFIGCAVCHGPDGRGDVDGNVPRVAGQHARVIIQQLIDYRHGKRWDPRMEHMADRHMLPDMQAIADTASFITTLEPHAPAGTGPGANLDLGRRTYLARCSSCHGRSGEGDDQALVPRLGGQHFMYLLRQFHDALEGRRPNLARTHTRMLKDLDRDGLQGMADMLSRSDVAGAAAPRNQ
jgi:cytochrome c553